MGNIAKLFLIALFVIPCVLAYRSIIITGHQLVAPTLGPKALLEDSVVSRLQTALRLKTISYDDGTLFDTQMFFKLRDHILACYPEINDQPELEIVNDMTLLSYWKGSDPRP